jgi:hypothetical protein
MKPGNFLLLRTHIAQNTPLAARLTTIGSQRGLHTSSGISTACDAMQDMIIATIATAASRPHTIIGASATPMAPPMV